jgi:hypothetical protein
MRSCASCPILTRPVAGAGTHSRAYGRTNRDGEIEMIDRYPSRSKSPSHCHGKPRRIALKRAIYCLVHSLEKEYYLYTSASPIGIGVWCKPIPVPPLKLRNPSRSHLEIANRHRGLVQTHPGLYIFGIYTYLFGCLEVIPTIPVLLYPCTS